jgi:hypothetical protein
MNKLIVFFLFLLVGCGILVGIVAGGGGVTTTYLTSNVSSNETWLNVTSTSGFLDEDDVIIGAEKIRYANINSTAFLNCTRAYGGTTAAAHVTGVKVYTERASAINNALGFNIGAMQDSLGWAAIIAIPFRFFVTTIPHVIKMSTTLLVGDLAIISWFFYAMAAGFVITLAMALISGIRTR